MVNQILSSLSGVEADSLLAEFELVSLASGALLYEEGGPMRHVYFPNSGMISRVAKIGRAKVESATIGSEGMLGLALFLGESVSSADCSVRIQGEAARLPAAAFVALAERSPAFSAGMKRYAATRLWVTYRLAGCRVLHSLASRCARCLLFAHDCVQGDQVKLTHASLAEMLGVRRVGVTLALADLQKEGVVSSRRGRMTILDRAGLEEAACECDALIRSRYNSLL